MTKAILCILAALGFGAGYLNARDFGDWPVRQQESIQKSFTLSGDPMRVVVDNVSGYVHVTAVDGSQVTLRAQKIVRAETDSDLDAARKEVSLQLKDSAGSVSILYDAPWRWGNGDRQRRFYDVTYDIDLQVPRGARLFVSTVNNGDVEVRKTSGSFEVKNVNGGITMAGISGSGDVNTVNGPISVQFSKRPSGACAMKTVNGSVDVYFPRDLSADLLFKTFNGQVYTDFDVTSRAADQAAPEKRDGKFVYHSNRSTAARVGQGGPEQKFETLNGDIRLHQQD